MRDIELISNRIEQYIVDCQMTTEGGEAARQLSIKRNVSTLGTDIIENHDSRIGPAGSVVGASDVEAIVGLIDMNIKGLGQSCRGAANDPCRGNIAGHRRGTLPGQHISRKMSQCIEAAGDVEGVVRFIDPEPMGLIEACHAAADPSRRSHAWGQVLRIREHQNFIGEQTRHIQLIGSRSDTRACGGNSQTQHQNLR